MKNPFRSLLLPVGLSWLAVALPLAAARAQTTDWDAGRDLIRNESNTAVDVTVNPIATVPQWSYGFRSGVESTDLTLFTPGQHLNIASGDYAGLRGFGDGPIHDVTVHPGGVPTTVGSQDPLAPNELFTSIDDHSGATSTVTRWTCPAAGNYTYTVRWHDLDPGGGDGAAGYVVLNGKQIFKGTWPNGRGQGAQTTGSLTLKAGDVLDTLLNSNGADSSYDTAGISIVINAGGPGSGGGPTGPLPADWDAGRDLARNEVQNTASRTANPNTLVPQWSYGYRATIEGTALTLFGSDEHTDTFADRSTEHGFGSHGTAVSANTGATPNIFGFCCGDLAPVFPNDMTVDANQPAFSSVVRWTAPAAGNYTYKATWEDIDPYGGNGAGGYVVVNGQKAFGQTWTNGLGKGATTTAAVSLKAGDLVDFVFNDNGDGNFDSTRFNATITPGGTPPPATAPDLNVGLNAKTGGLGNNNGSIANVGDKIVYTLTVNNYGTGDATNVVVRDNLPRGLSLKSADNGGALTQGNTVAWNLGTLRPNKPGEGRVLRLTAKVTTDAVTGSTIKNDSYSVQADGVQPIAGRDRDVATVVKPLVNVTADSDANSVRPGGQINYILHVNVGDTGRSAGNVVVSFNVPDNTNLLGATYFVNGVQTPATGAGKTLSFNLGTVAAGSAGRDLNISVQVPYDVAPAAAILLTPQVSAARADTGVSTVATLPVLSAALSGQAPDNLPRLVLVKFVPDAVQTAEVLQLVPAARPALELAFPGVSTAAGLADLQRTVNPDVLVGNGPDGFYEQEVVAPGRPGSPAQTFLTYALVYYNDANDNPAGGAAPNTLIVDRVPDYTAYVPGSAKVGLVAQEPTVTDNGKTLTFAVGKIKPLVNSANPGKPPRLGLLTYKVRVLAPSEGGRSALRTTIDTAPAFLSTPVLANRVPSFPGALSTVLVAPGHGLLEAIQRPVEFKAGNFKEYDISYKNNGGLPALDFQFADSYPAGSTFVSATPIRGRGGNVTDLNAATHSFNYHLGNVQPGESGTVRLRVQLTDAAVRQPGLVGTHSVGLVQEASFGPGTRRGPGNRGPVTRDVGQPLFDYLGNINVSRSEAPGAPKLSVGLSAPMSVKEGDPFDCLVFAANAGNLIIVNADIVVTIPDGAEFVSATVPAGQAGTSRVGTDADGKPAVIFPGTGTFVPPHGATIRTVTLRAPKGTAGKALRFAGPYVQSPEAVLIGVPGNITVAPVYSQPNSTYVYRPDQSFDSVRSQIVASALETQGFNTAALATTADFKAKVAALRPDAVHTSTGGVDGVQLSSGGFLAPLNVVGGTSTNVLAIGPASAFAINTNGLVAAGAGNLVAAGAGNLIAAGAGNFIELPGLVAAGAGNLVAAGAGNFVNARGGNLTALEGLGNLVAAGAGNIFIRQPNGQLIAAGAGNLVAAGAGNLVAAGAGNLIAAGAGNLISQDGSGLLSLDPAKLISQDGSGIIRGLTQNLISQDGSGLISQDGSGLISQDGSGLISQDGSGLLATKGGNSFAVGGGALRPTSGAEIVSHDGGGVVMLSGSALVAAGAGNFAPHLVAAGAGN